MKIAIDLRSAEGRKAGKGVYTFNIVKNLLKIDKDNDYILYCENPDTSVWNFPNVKIKRIVGNGALWQIRALMNVLKEKPDIFFAPSSFIIPYFLPLRIKAVVSIHDLISLLFPDTHQKKAVIIEKLLLSRVVKKAKKLCAVSENTKTDLIKMFNVDEKRVEIIYCAVSNMMKKLEKNEIEEIRKSNIVPGKYFLAVSTIEPRKNYLNLIRAFSIFSEKHDDYKLIIVGKKGWQYKDVFKEVKKLKIEKKVVFPDYIPEDGLVNLYNLSTALVFPSFYEGFGIPPLEAMKCGCPVIAANVSSIPEVLGDAGLFVDPNDPVDISKKMLKIVEDEFVRNDLISKGYKRVEQFSWEKSARKLLSVFNEI